MRVHVVSDVHGNAEALARAGEGADALIVLGDLIDFVDYHDHGNGILGALFGAENVRTFARLRREGRREETAAFSRELWSSLDDPAGAVDEAIREQYATLFAALSAPTYAIPGNVDSPALWPEFAGPGIHLVDGEVVEIGGLRFGFVGGALLPDGVVRRRNPVWLPYLRPREEFDKAAAGLRGIDVLCSHIPPAVPELVYDVVARRIEVGSEALLELITVEQPRWALFGHVHQPLAARSRAGRTECRNVGHFRKTARPYVLRW
ncbi:metallophosphoesterase [Prauserella oleivorans]|uniref:Metallophosphoesterase n=1 Tax=Prauserella oleivorans TaxID=1478153 RepID=A0ABW5W837_9PSEU